jgi:RNA polymerase sigma-70 factor (ECF subfamily)
MAGGDTTCWTVIRGAAQGQAADREEFVRRYSGSAVAYLRERWAGSPLFQDIDDSVQELFFECFRDGGALARAEERPDSSFRAYFFGVLRNVARRHEKSRAREATKRAPSSFDLETVLSREEDATRAFERAWAGAVMREAAERLGRSAKDAGEEARLRLEILRLRFGSDIPIREIAKRVGLPPARVHHEYARARKEFASELFQVVSFHHPGTPGEVRRECRRLLVTLRKP